MSNTVRQDMRLAIKSWSLKTLLLMQCLVAVCLAGVMSFSWQDYGRKGGGEKGTGVLFNWAFGGQARGIVYSSNQVTCYRFFPLVVAAIAKAPRAIQTCPLLLIKLGVGRSSET